MPSGKKQNEMEIFPNPLDKEWSFDGDSTQPSDFASSPKGLEPSESTDDMKPGEAKAKIAGEDMQALFDGVDEDGGGTIDKEEVEGPACMSLV